MEWDYDVIVIGSGGAGLSAVIMANAAGTSVQRAALGRP